jgi:hypothetical protein
MSNAFIRVPPDSTGKRILHSDMVIIDIDNLTISLDTIPFGATITGQTSNATGKFIGYDIRLGVLSVHVSNDSSDWIVGEQLIYDSVSFAEIVSVNTIFVPNISIVDADNHNPLKVDDNGAMFTRFTEGSQLFDAFGNTQVITNQLIDEHTFLYGANNQKYYDVIQTSGSITADVPKSMVKLSVNDQSGSLAQRTSTIYYPYSPGEGTYTIFSLGSGDEGKTGVVRRWGLYDDYNGVYFQLSGSLFSVNVVSSTSGTEEITTIPRTSFNGTRLQDANVDPFVIDFSKINLFWIDFQWLGSGRVRFGVIEPNGARTIIHTIENANSKTGPYMQAGTLPLRFEIFNETATASTSEFKLICISVMKQSFQNKYIGSVYTNIAFQQSVSGSGYSHLLSARPKTQIGGRINRSIALPESMQVNVNGDPVEIVLMQNTTLVGADFGDSPNPISGFDIETDNSVTISNSGSFFGRNFFGPGVSKQDFEDNILNGLRLHPNGTTQPIFTLAAKCPNPSGSATVDVIIKWREIK